MNITKTSLSPSPMGHPLFWKLCIVLIQGKLAAKTKFKKKTSNNIYIKFLILVKGKNIFIFMLKKPKTKKEKEWDE